MVDPRFVGPMTTSDVENVFDKAQTGLQILVKFLQTASVLRSQQVDLRDHEATPRDWQMTEAESEMV